MVTTKMNEKKLEGRKLVFETLVIEIPAVVAVLSGEGAVRNADVAERLGADLVEVRLDLVPKDPLRVIRKVREATALPIIATNRMIEEGGAFHGSEDERIEILTAASAWADIVDVELSAGGHDLLQEAVDVPVIISHHDFERAPPIEASRSILADIFEAGADIAKLALTPASLEDCLDLLKLLSETTGPTSLMGMGDVGRHLRVVAPIYGSVLTYGYIGRATAPGQIPVKTLREVLNVMMRADGV